MDDEAPAKKPTTHVIGCDLAALSIDELNERIALMRAEIARLEASITAKAASRNAADAFFRR